jgi:C-terminal processing protease CtpA/Prc
MKKHYRTLAALVVLSSLLLSSFSFFTPAAMDQNEGPAAQDDATGPVQITGSFEYTNDFVVETYYVEHAVALLDMTGFVKRDKEWELPVEGQVLGYMDLDAENNRATFDLSLPIQPLGEFNDVDQDAQAEAGVQIFVVGYSPNLTGDIFSDGDDRSLGWPSYLASVKTDTENQDEVTGGKLVIWAPDNQQDFPSGFGADGLLFTADDPQMALPAGYSVIDLDQSPFAIVRDRVADLTLYEPADIAVKDFSAQTFSQAFDSMFNIISKEYAFNGFEDKQPDWDTLYAQIAPRVADAETSQDAYAFFLALRDFAMAFKDGHVGLNGGDLEGAYNQSTVLGGYGFAVRELDDGSVVVVYVMPDGPAAQAGMQVGAEILRINGQDVQSALDAVPLFSPQSTDFGKRYEQSVFLTRSGIGDSMSVEFVNDDASAAPAPASDEGFFKNLFNSLFGKKTAAPTASGKPQTAELTAIYELDSLFAVYQGGDRDGYVLPVEYHFYADAGIGYIKINSNYDDLGLAIRVFDRALKSFTEAGALGIVIDMRHNYGGSPLGLAGFLFDEDIPLGQREYYSDKTGQFEPDGPRDKVYPNEEQYRFDSMVLLVDQFCYSACEIEAYGFSQVPGMVVMGQFPTAGVEAETARGDFVLPAGIEMTLPTGRFTLPDGSIFLEGQGVQPTVKLPVDRASVLSGDDVVLQAAIDYIMSQY